MPVDFSGTTFVQILIVINELLIIIVKTVQLIKFLLYFH